MDKQLPVPDTTSSWFSNDQSCPSNPIHLFSPSHLPVKPTRAWNLLVGADIFLQGVGFFLGWWTSVCSQTDLDPSLFAPDWFRRRCLGSLDPRGWAFKADHEEDLEDPTLPQFPATRHGAQLPSEQSTLERVPSWLGSGWRRKGDTRENKIRIGHGFATPFSH